MKPALRLKWMELEHPDRDLHFLSGFVCCDVSSCGLNQTGTKLIENYNKVRILIRDLGIMETLKYWTSSSPVLEWSSIQILI